MSNMPEKPNILIVHAYSHSNKGDYAIIKGMVKTIRTSFPNCKITISSIDENDRGKYGEDRLVEGLHSRFLMQKSKFRLVCFFFFSCAKITMQLCYVKLCRSKAKGYINECMKHDLVLACGGGYLYQKSWPNFILTLLTLFTPSYLNKKVILCAQTVGPFADNSAQRHLLKWVLQMDSIKVIHLRENLSLSLLKKWKLGHKCTLTPDLAWALNNSNLQLSPNKQQKIAYTVRRWFQNKIKQKRYEQELANALNQMAENGYKLAGLVQVNASSLSDNDEEATDRIYGLLTEKAKRDFQKYIPESPEDIISFLSSCQLLIGTRMHSNILALIAGTPIVAIGYQFKTEGIMQSLNKQQYVIDIKEVTANKIVSKAKAVLMETDKYISETNKEIKKLCQESQRDLRQAIEQGFKG